MTPEVSIIIVNWNGMEFIQNCLSSIVAHPPSESCEIVVVDNDSTDGSREWLAACEGEHLLGDLNFRVIESGANLGFGRANNLAFEVTDSRLMLLLNPDTQVSAGSIDSLINSISSSSAIGAAAPKILDDNGKLQYTVWAKPPSPLRIFIEGLGLARLIPRPWRSTWLRGRYFDYDHPDEVPIVSGAAMMIKREVIDQIGGFDPEIFMYGEDADLCWRMQKAGWKIFYEPNAVIFHVGGQSAAQAWKPLERQQREEEALLRFQKKYLSRYRLFANTLIRAGVFMLYKIRRRLRGKRDDNLDILIRQQLNFCKNSLLNR